MSRYSIIFVEKMNTLCGADSSPWPIYNTFKSKLDSFCAHSHPTFSHLHKRIWSSFALPTSVKDVSIYLDNKVKNQGISYDSSCISISKTSWPPYPATSVLEKFDQCFPLSSSLQPRTVQVSVISQLSYCVGSLFRFPDPNFPHSGPVLFLNVHPLAKNITHYFLLNKFPLHGL